MNPQPALLLAALWSVTCLPGRSPATLIGEGTPAVASASLLYIYASDPIYWPELTGKLLRENDTLLILPNVSYKVWCEVLPEGWPRISANKQGVIAHNPIPKKSLAHVELERNLFDTIEGLNSGAEPVKVACDYTDGSNRMKTEVFLRAFSVANATCDFSALSGLVAMGTAVSFTCSSGSGFPRPEHRCDVVTDDGAARLRAETASVTSKGESQVVTRFSVVASPEIQGASIECSTSQQIAYDGSGRSYKESHYERVLPFGKPHFTFAAESIKRCDMTRSGDYGVSVRCESDGGLPETVHSCWITSSTRVNSPSLPLMARIQGRMTYITEAAFNNSWNYQAGNVTCALRQRSFFARNFTFPIPAFRRSRKLCRFSKPAGGGLQAACESGAGLPASEQSCTLHLDTATRVLAAEKSSVQNGTRMSIFVVPKESLSRGSQIVCEIRQNEFPTEKFVHNVPRYTESSKICRFATLSGWEVRATCEFSSSGHPITHSDCRFLASNRSDSRSLTPDQPEPTLIEREGTFRLTYTLRLPGPDISHPGGEIECRLYQGRLFAKTFNHTMLEYRAPETTAATTPTVQGILTSPTTINTPNAFSTPKALNPSRTVETLGSIEGLNAIDTEDNLNARKTSKTMFPPRSRPPKATPPMPLIERRAEVPIRPTMVPAAAPETTGQPDIRISSQTAVTLSLTLLALVLLLLTALPIHFVRKYLRQNRKAAAATAAAAVSAGESQESADSLLSAPVPAVHRVRLAQAPHQLQQSSDTELRPVPGDVGNNWGYRAGRRDAIPDIDQYSMFEFGNQLDPSNKRMSILADALMRSEFNQNRKEFRFSM